MFVPVPSPWLATMTGGPHTSGFGLIYDGRLRQAGTIGLAQDDNSNFWLRLVYG
jgi:hypothetical protein